LKITLFFIFLALIILTFFYSQKNLKRPKVSIGKVDIFVEIADTPEKQVKGLAGRKSLKENEGMLFLFPEEGYKTFWMKGMLIPIDIIWINKDQIVHIDENVLPPNTDTPNHKLNLFTSPYPVDKVLEVHTGFSQKNGIKVGDKVLFRLFN